MKKKNTKVIRKSVKTKAKSKKISKIIPKKEVAVPKSWQPLRELALHTPYTMGYLSLMARRKQLKVKKFGRVWHSTMGNIKEFEEKMKQQKEERNERLRKSYIEKTEKVKISVMDEGKAEEILKKVQEDSRGNDTIFDEVQEELAEILHEIRNKEKKLRHNYMYYRGSDFTHPISRQGGSHLSREGIEIQKNKTERISEDLISDLGKLLKTASIIHEKAELEKRNEIGGKKRNLHDALRIEHKNHDHLLGNYHKDNFLSVPYSYFPFEDRTNINLSSKSIPFHNKVLLFISGVMVFIAAVLLVLVG